MVYSNLQLTVFSFLMEGHNTCVQQRYITNEFTGLQKEHDCN